MNIYHHNDKKPRVDLSIERSSFNVHYTVTVTIEVFSGTIMDALDAAIALLREAREKLEAELSAVKKKETEREKEN